MISISSVLKYHMQIADLLSLIGISQLYHCEEEFLCKLSSVCRGNQTIYLLHKLDENELFLKYVTSLITEQTVSSIAGFRLLSSLDTLICRPL